MQIEAFSELYTKYQDTETSPATVIKGKASIGSFCQIGPGVIIDGEDIPDNSTLSSQAIRS